MQIIWNITPAISLCFHYHFMAASQDNMTTSLVAFAWELWILKLTFVELLLSSLCNWSLILNIPLLISPWAYTVWNLCTVNSMHATYDSALHSALWKSEFFFLARDFRNKEPVGSGWSCICCHSDSFPRVRNISLLCSVSSSWFSNTDIFVIPANTYLNGIRTFKYLFCLWIHGHWKIIWYLVWLFY